MAHVVAGSPATQLALVNLGCTVVHIANSRVSVLRKLDPRSSFFQSGQLLVSAMKKSRNRWFAKKPL